MAKYVVFDIENKEPLKISSTLMQTDNEYSKDYIPGSEIRGAYIANYISENNVEDLNSGVHREKLLKGKIKFLNAYPVVDEKRSVPFPRCFYALKDDIKNYSLENKMRISINCEDSSKDFDRVKGFDFVNLNFEKKVLEVSGVDKIGDLHIRKEKKNKIFRYEAINSGEKFRGIVKCENDDLAGEVKHILQKGLFYIGGSKSSGYGKCNIENINIEDENPELKVFKDKINDFEGEKYFSIYVLSDILYRNKLGIYKSYIDEEYLKEKLELEEVEFKDSCVDMEYFTGFNNKWGCRLPMVNGIKMGSILTYKFKGKLKDNIIKEFEEGGIGERKQDGFGRFVILPDIMRNTCFKNFKKVVLPWQNVKTAVDEMKFGNREDREQFSMILDRIYLNKINKKLPKLVLDMDRRVKLNLTDNQFGKLTQLMNILLGMKYGEGVEKIKKYFNHISEKKINRELANAFEKPFIDGEPLKDYILRELQDENEADFRNKYGQAIEIGGIESKLHGGVQAMYEYKVRIFKELFRLQLKDDPKGGEN